MFCVVYRFQVKPGLEQQFEKAWAELTGMIYQYEGSLGSRLHRASGQDYIAYAQWPHREGWATASGLPPEADAPRASMREACDAIETVYELEVLDDRLEAQVAPGARDTHS